MPVQATRDLLANNNATVGELLNALIWLAKDVSHLKDRKKWIDQSALPEMVIDINNQITEEIRDVEELINLVKLRIKTKCTD